MAKFCGKIGFAEEERNGDVYKEVIVERTYYGDVIRNNRRLVPTEHLNDDINVTNEISIISDPYARDNFFKMRYVTWMNTKWKITDVTVNYPRLSLSIGGVYTETKEGSEEDF